VKQSHIKSLLKNTVIVAQPTNNATTGAKVKKLTTLVALSDRTGDKFEFI
jgi:hypothetical protein